MREERTVESLRTVRPVHWSWTAPLHIVGGALDPLTSAHINLAKYRGYYCNVSVAAPLVLLSASLRGVDESSAPWETASLISFIDESPG